MRCDQFLRPHRNADGQLPRRGKGVERLCHLVEHRRKGARVGRVGGIGRFPIDVEPGVLGVNFRLVRHLRALRRQGTLIDPPKAARNPHGSQRNRMTPSSDPTCFTNGSGLANRILRSDSDAVVIIGHAWIGQRFGESENEAGRPNPDAHPPRL